MNRKLKQKLAFAEQELEIAVNISKTKDRIIRAYQGRVNILKARTDRLQKRVAVLTKDRDKWVSEAELHSGEAARLATEVNQLRSLRDNPEFHNLDTYIAERGEQQ